MKKFLLAFLVASAVATIYGEVDGDAPAKKWVTKETGSGQDARDKVLDKILTGYKTYSYPENTTVTFGVTILHVDLVPERNVLQTGTWLRVAWTDNRLVWDEKETGVKLLRLPADKIWLPDVTLYNSANQDERLKCWDSNVIVYSTGSVLWVPPCQLESYCNLTLNEEPYAEQVCNMKFGSWTFDGFTQGLDFFNKTASADVQYYLGPPKYQITKNTAVREEKYYDCCVEPYISLTFTLGITPRKDTLQTCVKH